jgi:hypothetical protein
VLKIASDPGAVLLSDALHLEDEPNEAFQGEEIFAAI